MYPKNEKWPKIGTNIAIFYQKMDIMKDFLNFQGPGKLWEVKNFTKKPVSGQVDMYQE